MAGLPGFSSATGERMLAGLSGGWPACRAVRCGCGVPGRGLDPAGGSFRRGDRGSRGGMLGRFTATRTFWRSFKTVCPATGARKTFAIFKENPFDARLRSHEFTSCLLAMPAAFTPRKSKQTCESFSTSTEILSSPSTSARMTFIARECRQANSSQIESSKATASRSGHNCDPMLSYSLITRRMPNLVMARSYDAALQHTSHLR